MTTSHTEKPPLPPGSIEFELTDFDTARQALDALPDGVGRLPEQAPNYWQQRRRKPLPAERALAGVTIDWLMALPPTLRPHVLCERYPRVAYAIAAAWHGSERAAVLDGLLGDTRGQRHGFPADVRNEIEALRRAEIDDPHALNEYRPVPPPR